LGITATGTCVRKVSQDRASVSLASSSLQNNAGQAVVEATRIHEKLRSVIKALNLENASFDTESIQVNEEREWVDKKLVSRGFKARIGLSVESSDIPRMGEIITIASKQGVKEIGSLTTFVSSYKYKSEYEDCLELATKNAKDRAQKLAKGAGVKLGKVKIIAEGPNSFNSIPHVGRSSARVMALGAAMESSEPAPSIDTKPLEMNVSATVVFQVD
jgi:uncharacterized protein YggE